MLSSGNVTKRDIDVNGDELFPSSMLNAGFPLTFFSFPLLHTYQIFFFEQEDIISNIPLLTWLDDKQNIYNTFQRNLKKKKKTKNNIAVYLLELL